MSDKKLMSDKKTPTSLFLHDYYEREALEEDRQKKMYDADIHNSYWQNIRLKEITNILKGIDTKNFIDIGCAEGLYMNIFKHFHIDGKAFGLDIARNYLKKVGNEDTLLIQGDVNNLPFKANLFDTVLCSETLEHVIDPKGSLYELYNITRKYLIISVPGHTPFYFLGKYIGIVNTNNMPDTFSSPGKGHINELDVKRLKKILSEKNIKYRIVKQKTYCYLPPELMKKYNIPLVMVKFIDRIINYIPFLNSFGLVQILVIEKT